MSNEVIEGFRLSTQQQRLWTLSSNNARCAILLTGRLDTRALQEALLRVLARHEILQTTFQSLPGMDIPLQLVSADANLCYQEVDLSTFDFMAGPDRVEQLLRRELQIRLDPNRGPVICFLLAKISREQYLLRIEISPLCADQWTIKNLIDEIGRAYDAGIQRESLSGEPLQYVQFAEWQHEILDSEDAEVAREYWKNKQSATSTLRLPLANGDVDKCAPADAQSSASAVSVALEESLTGELDLLAQKHEVSLSTCLLACWQILLWRLGGWHEAVVFSLFHGRKYEELTEMLGPTANYLPVVGQLRMAPYLKLEDVLRATEQEIGECEAWQEYFNDDLVRCATDHPKGNAPLPFGFDFTEWPKDRSFADVLFSLYSCDLRDESFGLRLSAVRRAGRLNFTLYYDSGLYANEHIERVARAFVALVKSLVSRCDAPIGALDILDEQERRAILVDWNATKTHCPKDRLAHEIFEEQVERTPDRSAVVFKQDVLSFRELNRRANRLARRLLRAGLQTDSLVVLYLERSADQLVALLATLKAGGAYVPVDVGQPHKRVRLIMNDIRPSAIVTRSDLAASLRDFESSLILLDSDWPEIEREDDDNLINTAATDSLAYVIYTSGSTGQPKGILIQHGSLVNLAACLDQTIYREMGSGLRVGLNSPLAFDSSVKQLLQLFSGHTICILPEEVRRDGVEMLDYINCQDLEVMDCTPSLLKVLLDSGFSQGPAAVLVGGEAIDAPTWVRLASKSSIRFYNLYGPTECTVDATACRVSPASLRPTIGRPLPNVTAYILDDHLEPVPIGVAEQLRIGGVGLARGYLNRPDLTAEKFLPNPYGDEAGARLYKTGDLARYYPDGNIEFLGRLDHQVKVRGSRVELGEIDAVLKQHPAIRYGVVVVQEELGEERLVAYIVTNRKGLLTVAELRSFLEERLPDYMVPSSYIVLDSLPLNSNGKVDRSSLAAMASARLELGSESVAPRNPVELQLVQIWEELLGVRPIGVKDSFFDLGGHSLLAVRLSAQIQKRFGQTIPLTVIFNEMTVENIARALRAEVRHRPASPLLAIQPGGLKRPFFCIHPIGGGAFCYTGLARRLGADQPFYGLDDSLSLYTDEDPYITFDEMAATYISALRDAQPSGPYLIGGWSFGGAVAFEMACQLQKQGEEVALLAILDCKPISTFTHAHLTDTELLLLIAEDMAQNAKRELGLPRDFCQQIDPDQQWEQVLEALKRNGLVPNEIEVPHLRRYVLRHRAREKVRESYVPEVYPGKITLFRAAASDNESASVATDPTYGWEKYSPQPVEVHVVPGHHLTMIYEPNVTALAEKLADCIHRSELEQS